MIEFLKEIADAPERLRSEEGFKYIQDIARNQLDEDLLEESFRDQSIANLESRIQSLSAQVTRLESRERHERFIQKKIDALKSPTFFQRIKYMFTGNLI